MKKLISILIVAVLLSLTGCGTQKSTQPSTSTKNTSTNSSTASNMSFKVAKAETTKNMTITNDTVGPVVDVIHVGDTVTWENSDSSSHDLVTYPNAPQSFEVTIQGNKKGTFKFTKPGIYRYYGNNVATYSKKMGDVEAKKQAKAYPIPMRGVVVVMNTNNTLPVSKSASVDVPDSTMAFTPWNLTVNKRTTVSFNDHDDMNHMVASVPGFVSKQTKTLTLKKDGGTGQLTFNQPGVYYYYCPMHAQWNEKTEQLTPEKSYGSFPFVMDGLIVVNNQK